MRSFRFRGVWLGVLVTMVGCQSTRSGAQWCSNCGKYHGSVAATASAPVSVASTPFPAVSKPVTMAVPPVPPAAPVVETVTPVSNVTTAEIVDIPPSPAPILEQ
jgi:hypothetical protein